MPDETAEELIAKVQAQAAMAYEQHVRNVDAVVAQGREDFQNFDENMDGLRDAVGADKLPEITALSLNFENPSRLLNHLAENPSDAKRVAGMSPGRRAAELARIEARLMPDAVDASSAEAAWIKRAKGGEKARDLNDPSISDQDFERLFRKKYPQGFIPPRLR
jgi:hypothetical protein